MGPVKFLYNSKFDFTAKSLVTNTVVITRVLCNCLSLSTAECGPNMVYKPDITTDQATCKNPSQPQIVNGPPVEGCVCLPGYLYDSAKDECVDVDNCGCVEGDEYYSVSTLGIILK